MRFYTKTVEVNDQKWCITFSDIKDHKHDGQYTIGNKQQTGDRLSIDLCTNEVLNRKIDEFLTYERKTDGTLTTKYSFNSERPTNASEYLKLLTQINNQL